MNFWPHSDTSMTFFSNAAGIIWTHISEKMSVQIIILLANNAKSKKEEKSTVQSMATTKAVSQYLFDVIEPDNPASALVNCVYPR